MGKNENMIDNYEFYNCDFNFQDLCELVIEKNTCVFCGTCISLCPRIGVKGNEPILLQRDAECSMCFRYCPKTFFPKKKIEDAIYSNCVNNDYLLGCYQNIIAAKSTNKLILEKAQNGGIVTTLLIHALNVGLIDGVLLTGRDENWLPKPKIARTPEEILAASGSKYNVAPTLLLYSDMIYNYKLKKPAFVGMPCQILAARKLQQYPPLSEEFGKFALMIGLYCTSNYSHDLMKKYLFEKIGIKLSDVQKFDLSREKFILYMKDESFIEIPIEETQEFIWPGCQYCKDSTAEFSDISVGSLGAPSDNWNSVIIRSEIGKKIFDDAIINEKIITTNMVDLSKIKEHSLKKKSKITKIDDKIISAMGFLNVNDIEVKTYAILLSLGDANISMLSKVMKLEESKIRRILNNLMKREWILKTDGVYSSINPNNVVKNEINKVKKDFERKVNKVKSEALVDLETLYIQNNLYRVKYKDYFDQIFY